MRALFFIIVIAFWTGITTYVGIRSFQALSLPSFLLKCFYIAIYILIALSVPLVMALRHQWAKAELDWILISGGTIMLTIIYATLFFLAFDIIRGIIKLFHIPLGSYLTVHYIGLKRLFFIAGCLTMTIFFILGNKRYRHPLVTEIELNTSKPLNEKQELNILFFSDLHLNSMVNAQRLQSYIDLINRQTFDVILIGGDFIDGDEQGYANRSFDLIFSQLKPKYGVYTVAGNHEYYDNFDASQAFVKSLGFHFLKDEIAYISDSSVIIVGRDDRTNSQRQPIEKLLPLIDSSKYVIVLDHQPSELDKIANTSADLVLCGHTHNGQVFPLTAMIGWMWKVAYGQAKIDNTDIYVSSGLGLWGMPYRIGSDSEIVVIRIKG